MDAVDVNGGHAPTPHQLDVAVLGVVNVKGTGIAASVPGHVNADVLAAEKDLAVSDKDSKKLQIQRRHAKMQLYYKN
jgi:hypothetical protein